MKTTKSSKSKNAVQLFNCAAFKFLWRFDRKLIASSMRAFFHNIWSIYEREYYCFKDPCVGADSIRPRSVISVKTQRIREHYIFYLILLISEPCTRYALRAISIIGRSLILSV